MCSNSIIGRPAGPSLRSEGRTPALLVLAAHNHHRLTLPEPTDSQPTTDTGASISFRTAPPPIVTMALVSPLKKLAGHAMPARARPTPVSDPTPQIPNHHPDRAEAAHEPGQLPGVQDPGGGAVQRRGHPGGGRGPGQEGQGRGRQVARGQGAGAGDAPGRALRVQRHRALRGAPPPGHGPVRGHLLRVGPGGRLGRLRGQRAGAPRHALGLSRLRLPAPHRRCDRKGQGGPGGGAFQDRRAPRGQDVPGGRAGDAGRHRLRLGAGVPLQDRHVPRVPRAVPQRPPLVPHGGQPAAVQGRHRRGACVGWWVGVLVFGGSIHGWYTHTYNSIEPNPT